MSLTRRALLRGLGALGVSALAWPPLAHLAFRRGPAGREQIAIGLLERLLGQWQRGGTDFSSMRSSNPEWDFMGRTFLVLALVNRVLARPELALRVVAVLDDILTRTLAAEAEHGQEWFLLSYVHSGVFRGAARRSLFVDGEIALMLGARRVLSGGERWRGEHLERVAHVLRSLEEGPILCGESYPDECWTFCNTTALAALTVHGRLEGIDHTGLFDRWVHSAREHLVHPDTGILVSSFTWNGGWLDGPEGSSIWWSAHALDAVDRAFAADQYERARHYLGRSLLGFGYAREWPESWESGADIDSGPTVPLLDANAGSSGLALVGAGAFHDERWLRALVASLDLAAFPVPSGGGVAYQASNAVGDAALLYALVQGPLWAWARGEA